VTVEPAPDGGVRVLEVLPESPASRETSRLERGDVILAVDGERLDPTDSFFSFFDGTTGRDVLLDVRSASGRRREVVIRPESRRDFRLRVYERDVHWRRSLTDSISGGRLGYINLRSMSAPNVDQFERELFEVAAGKDGLVIDVRDNVGGWVTDILLSSLLAGDHAVAIPRGGGPGYPTTRRLLYAWTKPIVVVCNGQTFSNGEIFSWAIQTLGRGKLVGEPTFGGVVSTGERRLLDGSQVREPGRGWWVNRGPTPEGRIRMEGSGCVPDVTVEAAPDDYPRRRDPQLSAAVKVLLEELR
jgi:tricorn protease